MSGGERDVLEGGGVELARFEEGVGRGARPIAGKAGIGRFTEVGDGVINKFTLKEMELLEKNECYLIDMGKDYAIIYLASDVFKHLFEIYFERLDNKEERSNIIIVKPNTL